MNIGDRVVAKNFQAGNRTWAEYHGKIVALTNGAAKIKDDWGFTRWIPESRLELE